MQWQTNPTLLNIPTNTVCNTPKR